MNKIRHELAGRAGAVAAAGVLSLVIGPAFGQGAYAQNQSAGATSKTTFALRSPAVGADGVLPVAFTGDGESVSPPLQWSGAPAGVKAYALIMHHVDPEGKTKWYWTLYNIRAGTHSLAKGSKGVGTLGNNSVDHKVAYAPPHSKGPGKKVYTLTLYALREPVRISQPPIEVTRDVLLQAMKGRIVATAELKVNYTRSGGGGDERRDGPPDERGGGPEDDRRGGPLDGGPRQQAVP